MGGVRGHTVETAGLRGPVQFAGLAVVGPESDATGLECASDGLDEARWIGCRHGSPGQPPQLDSPELVGFRGDLDVHPDAHALGSAKQLRAGPGGLIEALSPGQGARLAEQ